MLIKLDPQVERDAQMEVVESNLERAQRYAEFHLSQKKLLEDDTLNPTIWEKQRGHMLTHNQLLDILRKVNPNFKYGAVLGNPNTLRLILDTPDFQGTGIDPSLKQLCLVSSGEMPEYSFFNYYYDDVPDMDILRGKRKVERADLPASQLMFDPDTGQYKLEFDPTKPKPGYIRVKRPHHEVIRGWRTVIAHVVGAYLCSPEFIEPLLPTQSDRASWAQKMGKNAVSEF